jgi:hypothetical protein
MQRLKMKIHEYDEETHSLVVSFASDENDLDVGEYRKYTYNIGNFNPDDLRETIYAIAIQGVEIAANQKIEEDSKKNFNSIENAKLEVDKVYEFDLSELIPEGAVLT